MMLVFLTGFIDIAATDNAILRRIPAKRHGWVYLHPKISSTLPSVALSNSY